MGDPKARRRRRKASAGHSLDERVSPTEIVAWRHAAKVLRLRAADSRGEVDAEYATRDHELRGTVAGHDVTLSYDREKRLTIARAELARPLRLGLTAHAWVPPKTPSGRSLGGFRTAQIGIDQARANELFHGSREGRELADAMKSLGVFGWVELSDHEVQAEVEVLASDDRLYISLLERSVQIAQCAVRARAALPAARWELDLAEALRKAATAHRLRVAEDGLSIEGDMGGCPVELRLDAAKRYSLFSRAWFPAALPGEPFIEPRRGFLAKLRAWLGGGPTRNRRFNRLFEASDHIDGLLPDEAFDMFSSLMSRTGAAALDATAIRYRTTALDANPTQLLERISALRALIADMPASSPYR